MFMPSALQLNYNILSQIVNIMYLSWQPNNWKN